MKKLIFAVAAAIFGLTASAQSISVYSGAKEKLNFSPEEVDSIVFNKEAATGVLTARPVNGTWCSVGTSITWYNNNVATGGGRFTRGYQDRVMDKLAFAELINVGHNGGVILQSVNLPTNLDSSFADRPVPVGVSSLGVVFESPMVAAPLLPVPQ